MNEPRLQTALGRPAFVLAALLLIPLAGCRSTSTDRYVPESERAREVLTAALDAWKSGKPVGHVDHAPSIEVVDSRWRAGDKLSGYEISGEDTTPEGHRRFSVKLTMQQPAGTQEARFVVFGIDPLWVYREEDYKKLSGI
jgi:hypothetical protein